MPKKRPTAIGVEHLESTLLQIIMQCGAVLAALDSLDAKQRRSLRFSIEALPAVVVGPPSPPCPKPISVQTDCRVIMPSEWFRMPPAPPDVRRKKKKAAAKKTPRSKRR